LAQLSLASDLLMDTLPEIQAAAELSLLFSGRGSLVKAGLVYLASVDSIDSVTVQSVNASERGFWLKYGIHVGPLFNNYGLQLDGNIGSGSMGFALGDFYQKGIDHVEQNITSELGVAFAPYVIINALKWQPQAFLQSGPLGRRLAFAFEFRSGSSTRYRWPDYIVKVDQYAPGVTLYLFPQRGHLQINPFITTLLGIRNETIYYQTNFRTESLQSVLYPVVQAELGVLLNLGNLFAAQPHLLYGFAFCLEGFVQLPTSTDAGLFYEGSAAQGLSFSLRFVVTSVG
jgi:hypothetical protein